MSPELPIRKRALPRLSFRRLGSPSGFRLRFTPRLEGLIPLAPNTSEGRFEGRSRVRSEIPQTPESETPTSSERFFRFVRAFNIPTFKNSNDFRLISFFFNLLQTILHHANSQVLSFQAITHSFAKTGGVGGMTTQTLKYFFNFVFGRSPLSYFITSSF